MNAIKSIAASLFMATALVAGSTTAYAKPAGQDAVTAAAENTISNIELAISLMEKGGDNAAVLKAISTARQQQKEFRFELTERQRSAAVNLLKRARTEIDGGNMQPAEQTLKEALTAFKEMKAIYDKTH